MYAVGIGEAKEEELRTIASKPVDEHFLYGVDFSAMEKIAMKLKSKLCDGKWLMPS